MPELSDAIHRRRALTDHSATLLVEAGAGTGKTSLLAGRVALLLASGVHPRNVAAITFTELAASELLQRIQEYVRELVSGNVPEPLQIAMAEDFARRTVGTSFIGGIRRRGTHGQTDGIPLIGGSRIGRTDVYDHPWILSAADYALSHRGKCRSGCGNDGRRRSRSEPQDVATAVAPKSPGGATGGRSTRRAVGDRRGAGSKADRATGRSPPSSSDRTRTGSEAVTEPYRRIPQLGYFVSEMVCGSTESRS